MLPTGPPVPDSGSAGGRWGPPLARPHRYRGAGGPGRPARVAGVTTTPTTATARDIAEVPAAEVIASVRRPPHVRRGREVRPRRGGRRPTRTWTRPASSSRRWPASCTAARPDLGVHAAPLRDGLQALQKAFREASREPDAPGEGPGRAAHRPRLSHLLRARGSATGTPGPSAGTTATARSAAADPGQHPGGQRGERCRVERSVRHQAEHRTVGVVQQAGSRHRLVPQRVGDGPQRARGRPAPGRSARRWSAGPTAPTRRPARARRPARSARPR